MGQVLFVSTSIKRHRNRCTSRKLALRNIWEGGGPCGHLWGSPGRLQWQRRQDEPTQCNQGRDFQCGPVGYPGSFEGNATESATRPADVLLPNRPYICLVSTFYQQLQNLKQT